MGYWSGHFMGGDTPMDYSAKIKIAALSVYKPDDKRLTDEYYKIFDDEDFNDDDFANCISNHMDELINNPECNNFAFPYFLAEWDVYVKDLDHIEKLKDMIGDGDASKRGYELLENFDPNKFEDQPDWYAEHFKRFCIPLLNIKDDEKRKNLLTQYFEMFRSKGLFETITEKLI